MLGEGIRQALLRDPTYVPALRGRRRRCCRERRADHAAPTPRRSPQRAAARRRRAARERARERARRRPPGAQRRHDPGAHLRAARRGAADWDGVEVWFADERCVGPEDPESNYRLAAETLLEPRGDPGRARPPHGGRARPRAGRASATRRRCASACRAGAGEPAGARLDRARASARTGTSPRCSPAPPRWRRASARCAWACTTRPSRRPSGSR